MANYAKVIDGIVDKVIVSEQDFIDRQEGTWIESSTASIGFSYDAAREAFVPPKPHPSYILDENKNDWNPPVAHPADGKFYTWDESITNWVETT